MNPNAVEYNNVTQLNFLQKLIGKRNSIQNRRCLVTFKEDHKLPTNQIHTSKYTAWNFLPKNLWEQFTKPSNVYFLIIGIFQIIPQTTLTNGLPMTYIPLGVIMLASAIKDFYEDCKRSDSDKSENTAMYTQLSGTHYKQQSDILSKDIRPGMVIKIKKEQQIPVDGLIVNSSEHYVYLSTKNLDGQTNLKRKSILKFFSKDNLSREMLDVPEIPQIPIFKIDYQPPNDLMESFTGHITFDTRNTTQTNQSLMDNKPIEIDIKYICMRGSTLMKTDYIYLLVLYTGPDTKILMSMNKPPTKRSTIQRKLGRLIIMIFCLIVLLAIIMAILKVKTRRKHTYFSSGYGEPVDSILSVVSWILNLTYYIFYFRNLVPISLIVTLETVKLLQGKVITMDPKMRNNDFESKVNSSYSVQDLGTIEFVASDKTGTLTKNKLTLRQINDSFSNFYNQPHSRNPDIDLLQLLCLCHEAYVSQHTSTSESDTYEYEGQSQDEICILDYCKSCGCTLVYRSQDLIRIQIGKGKDVRNIEFQILELIEFTSDRKRQSVIYRRKIVVDEEDEEDQIYEEPEIYIVCKGADNQISKRLHNKQSTESQNVMDGLNSLAFKGYRTLVMAGRKINTNQALQWVDNVKRIKSNQAISKEEEARKALQLGRLFDEVEIDFEPICAIGIEDELQDDVPGTIRTILQAGINFVIISGDKRETVKSIAENLHTGMQVVLADQDNIYHEKYEKEPLVVFGRCTPREKEKIVSKMRGRVLAIGDGANDVSMLTKACVGVGIAGKQGRAAVQAADFGIPEFRYLRRLMFYYGRELYRKNSELVKYNFYKNFIYAFPQVTFAFFSGYTGVSIYEAYLSQLYNLIFTSLPIIVYSLCDEAENEDQLQNNEGNLYALSKKQVYFSNGRIFLQLLEAVVLGFVTSYLCFILIPIVYRSPDDLNLYEISSILMLYVVFYANLRVMLMEKRLNLMIFITVVVGIAGYFACFRIIILFSTTIESTYQVIFRLKTGLVILICILASLIVTLLFETILSRIYRRQQIKLQIIEHQELDANNTIAPVQ